MMQAKWCTRQATVSAAKCDSYALFWFHTEYIIDRTGLCISLENRSPDTLDTATSLVNHYSHLLLVPGIIVLY